MNSIGDEPLFYDLDHGDLRLKPESPVLGLGFEQFDPFPVGLTADYKFADVNEPLSRLFIKAGDEFAAVNLSSGQTVASAVYGRTGTGFVKNMSGPAVAYESSNLSVATVDVNGVITGVSPGKAYITASAQGVTTRIAVNVDDRLARIYLATKQTSFKSGLQQFVYVGGVTEQGSQVSLGPDEVTLVSSDPNVLTVENGGIVSPKHEGTATLTAIWHEDGRTLTAQQQIAVFGHLLQSASVTAAKQVLSVGDSVQIQAAGTLDDGTPASLSNLTVQFESEDEHIVTVNAEGLVTAVSEGNANVIAHVAGYGGEQTIPMKFKVGIPAWETGPNVVNLSGILSDGAGWNPAVIPDADGSVTFDNAWQSVYSGQMFQDAVFEFKMNYSFANDGSDWPSIALRADTADNPISSTTYIMVIKQDVLELHKFIDGTRNVLIGSLPGFSSKFGTLDNMQFTSGEHLVQFGAVNVLNGVRLLCNVDGYKVFDVTDDSNPLTNAGYFAVYANSGPITLSGVDKD
jgi:hypothetical protein